MDPFTCGTCLSHKTPKGKCRYAAQKSEQVLARIQDSNKEITPWLSHCVASHAKAALKHTDVTNFQQMVKPNTT